MIVTDQDGDHEKKHECGGAKDWISAEPELGEKSLHAKQRWAIEAISEFDGWLEDLSVWQVKEIVRTLALQLPDSAISGAK